MSTSAIDTTLPWTIFPYSRSLQGMTCRSHPAFRAVEKTARADKVHVPAEPPDALVDDSFMLFGDAVLVLAVYAGVCPEPERLREVVVEGCFFEEVYRGAHPEDEVAEERVEVERYILRFQVGMPRHALEPEEYAGAVLGEQSTGVDGGRGIRRAGHVLPVALATKPALEPHPLRNDHIVGRYLPRLCTAFPCKGGEFIDLLPEFPSHRTSPR